MGQNLYVMECTDILFMVFKKYPSVVLPICDKIIVGAQTQELTNGIKIENYFHLDLDIV